MIGMMFSVAWFFLKLVLIWTPAWALSKLSTTVSEKSPTWLQVSAWVAWSVAVGFGLYWLAAEEGRQQLFEKYGAWVLVAAPVNIFLGAIVLFSTVMRLLQGHGWVEVTTTAGGSPATVTDLHEVFLWHFSDAIPLLDVNETIRWSAPVSYNDSAVGWLLLLFKLAMIIPLIATFRSYWKYRVRDREAIPQE